MTRDPLRATSMLDLHRMIRECTRCPLAASRTRAVPGEGPVPSDIMLVGEAPGPDEDAQGWPFVGRAGFLLDQLLLEIGVERGAVYITNTVKCFPYTLQNGRKRPRPPAPDEHLMCSAYLAAQIRLVRPKLIVACGTVAARTLAHGEARALAGRTVHRNGTPVFVIHHPSWALRSEDALKRIRQEVRALGAWLRRRPDIRTRTAQYAGCFALSPFDGDPSHPDEVEVRSRLLRLAASKGFPRVTVRPGESVMPGENAWRAFCSAADPSRVAAALRVLSQIDATPVEVS
jgi:DNA polymerase